MDSVTVTYVGFNPESHHLQLLQAQEPGLRTVLEQQGHRGQFQWGPVYDELGNIEFHLLSATTPSECIVKVGPLDLTLTLGEFERLLWEGRAEPKR